MLWRLKERIEPSIREITVIIDMEIDFIFAHILLIERFKYKLF